MADVNRIKFVDKYAGNIILFFIHLFGGSGDKEISKNIRKILVIQFWGIGETVTTLPALHALRKIYPKAEITVLATERNRDVYYKNKDIDKLVSVKMGIFSLMNLILGNMRKYDLVVDMEEYLNISAIIASFAGKQAIGFDYGFRSKTYNKRITYNDKQHTVHTFLDLIRLLGETYKPKELIRLNHGEKHEEKVSNFLNQVKIKRSDMLIGITPGAAESSRSRMWPLERFAELADMLIEKYSAKIIFIGSADETDLIDKIRLKMKNGSINAAGRFSLIETFALIERCKAFISNDTGPMHIAAAQGVRTIGLFGPNTPVRWKPFGEKNKALYVKQECSPCINTHLGVVPECIYKGTDQYQKCMKAISVGDVIRVFSKQNNQHNTRNHD